MTHRLVGFLTLKTPDILADSTNQKPRFISLVFAVGLASPFLPELEMALPERTRRRHDLLRYAILRHPSSVSASVLGVKNWPPCSEIAAAGSVSVWERRIFSILTWPARLAHRPMPCRPSFLCIRLPFSQVRRGRLDQSLPVRASKIGLLAFEEIRCVPRRSPSFCRRKRYWSLSHRRPMGRCRCWRRCAALP